MKKLLLCVMVLLVFVAPIFLSGSTKKGGAEEETVEVLVWWWGEGDTPGSKAWLEETAEKFTQQNPTIEIELVEQTMDQLMPAWEASIEAKEGADIQFLWTGIWALEYVWEGHVEDLAEWIPESEMGHWIATEGLEYQGRPWLMPWYQISIVWMYNKELFKKAGLDPNRPPETWDEFVAQCEALKRAGITPVSQGGLKDAWGVDWLYALFAPAAHDSTKEFIVAATEPGSFLQESHKDWLRKLKFLYDNGYTDPNAMSLDFFQGRELFLRGEAGFGVATNGQAIQWIEDMGGEDVVDIMKVPVKANGALAGKVNNQSHSFCIPSFAKHKREAADFITFMHQPEQLKRWYEITRNIPCDDRFDTSVLSSNVEKKFYDYLVSEPTSFPGIYIPVMVDIEGSYAAGQLIFSGGTVDEAAQLVEDSAEKWRETDPEGLEQFKEWAKEYD